MQLSLSTQYLAQVTKHNITCCKLVDTDNANVYYKLLVVLMEQL